MTILTKNGGGPIPGAEGVREAASISFVSLCRITVAIPSDQVPA